MIIGRSAGGRPGEEAGRPGGPAEPHRAGRRPDERGAILYYITLII